MNYALFHNLPEDTKIVQEENPTILMKATKNEVELANIREAHIKDGVAVTKFMYWLKQNIGKVPMTECSASDQLEAFRAQQEGFLQPSFSPICGFGEHGAIIHYFATPETDATLEKGSFFLADTGGHYLQGSTDITRTFALGEVSDEAKRHFTTVAISNLSLANVEFLHGCTGINLDYVAREPFWRQHLNYNHGTGHGVGYLGNIHEPPSGFHFKGRPTDLHPLEANMVLTDEPGIYLEGQYGIRLENELVVRNGVKNAYGQFMYFETITFVPFDLDAIDPSIMTQHEKDLLNAYHEQVYAKIAPYLEEEERVWLQEYTRNI
jgi:Xaa-Pro aminopeptidase